MKHICTVSVMKHLRHRIAALVALSALFVPTLKAQVSVTATSGILSAGYTTLKEAFDSVNTGAHRGIIAITLNNNTTEPAAVVIKASGTGGASYITISLKPTGGALRTVTGNFAGGLFQLDGADSVMIDGVNSGGNAFEFSNTNTNGSVIAFSNDACRNSISNVTLKGVSTSVSSGVVTFGTGAASGNDNNTITQCAVDGGATTPANCIYSAGTATPGLENSGNTISGNTIANFFSAGSASMGINLAGGSAAWTIINNKFYQTASRTYTTANIHKAIGIAGGGNGYTITGNTIGYASAASTGTYTMAGTPRFIGIELAAGTTVTSVIQNNTIASISVSTNSGAATFSGILCGISVLEGNVNITGNTIGAVSGTSSLVAIPTTAQGTIVGVNSSSTGIITIHNNTMGGFLSSGTTASVSGGIIGINVSGAAASMTITSNIIGNTTANNMQAGTSGLTTGASLVSGVSLPSPPLVLNLSNNTIRNLTSWGTSATGFVRGIWTVAATGSTASFTITSNTITNLSSNNTNAGLANGHLGAVGVNVAVGSNSVISQNTISNIYLTNTGTAATHACAISVGNAINSRAFGNRIYGIRNDATSTSATAPATASGILVRSGTTAVNVYNNMISLGSGQTTNTAFIGVYCNHGSTPNPIDSIYNNTIHIEGTVASGAQPSIGIFRGDFSTTAKTITVFIKNNILNNQRTGGTGKHYAIANNINAPANATGWGVNASNNNLLNTASPATVGYWGADMTFAAWKTISGCDALSYSAAPLTFVNNADDLHLNMGTTATFLESNGTTIPGLSTDYDGDVRPGPAGSINGGAMQFDIGADEFDGVYLDVAPPAFSFTPLTTASTSNRVVSNFITATDYSGINTAAGTKPRLYYKKTTDANDITGWKYVEASNSTSPFSFTIDYSLLNSGSVSLWDQIQYFVTAQDLSPAVNVGISNGGFAAQPASVALTSAAFPIAGSLPFYNISQAYSGTYTVGAGGTYATLKAFFDSLNVGTVTGNLQINVVGNTTETATAQLNPVLEEPAGSNFSIVLKPSGGTAKTITGTLGSAAVIKTVGVSRFTIDGLNTGGDSLSIINLATTAPLAVHIASSGTTPVTSDTIRNITAVCNLNTGTTLSSIGIVFSDQATDGFGAGYFNGVTVQGCTVKKAQYGIAIVGGAAAGTANALNARITGNMLNVSGGDAIGTCAILMQGVNGGRISQNIIGNFEGNANSDDRGIWLATGSKNSVIERNHISSIKYAGTDGFGSYGIYVTTGETASNNMIRNNVIADISGDGKDYTGTNYTDNVFGIFCNLAQTGIKIYNNSINLTGNTLNQTNALTAGIALGTGSTADIRNNNIVNNQGLSAGTGYGTTGIFLQTNIGQLENANYNNYYISPTGSGIKAIGKVGTTDYIDLASWRTATSAEANSISVNPLYTGLTNLIPTSCNLNNKGSVLTQVTTDFNAAVKDATNPDLGAFEFTPEVIDAPAVASPLAYCQNAVASALNATGANTLVWFNASSGGAGTTTAPTPLTTSAGSTTYYVADSAASTGCISSRSAIVVNVTVPVTGNTITSGPQTICSNTTPAAITASSATGGDGTTYTYSWLSSTTSATAGFSPIASSNTQGYAPGSITASTWYKRTVSSGACANDTTAAVKITISNTNTWTGTTSTAWSSATNWGCGRIPVSTDSVVIVPASNQPIITDGGRVANSLTITSGSTLTLNNTLSSLSVSGIFTQGGTLNNSNGTIVLNGTTSQVIPSGSYHNLTINNASGTTLGGTATVNGILTFTSGALTLNNNNLTLAASGSFAGVTATNYIKTNAGGTLTIQNIGTGGRTGIVTFPVGNSAYNPAIITNTGTADDYSVHVIDSVTSTYTGSIPTGAKVTANAVNRTWMITEAVAGGSNATVSVQWNATDELGGFSRGSSYLAKYTGSSWLPTAASAAAGSDPYTQTRSNITSFSPFGVGSGVTLPVQLVSFTASRKGKVAELSWTTASEINNDHFEVERSADGKEFELVGNVKGNGTKASVSNYRLTDNLSELMAKRMNHIYYRLTQVDHDGRKSESEIVKLNIADALAGATVNVQPNPFVSNVSVVINNVISDEKITLNVVDLTGRVVAQQVSDIVSGDNVIEMKGLAGVNNGVYLINVHSSAGIATYKIVKVN